MGRPGGERGHSAPLAALTAGAVHFIGRPHPDVLAFVVPYSDRTGLCLYFVQANGSGMGSGCTSAEDFNSRGLVLTADGADGGYTTIVFAEGTRIGDVGDATIHPSGIAATVKGVRPDIAVADGRLDLLDVVGY